METVTLTATTGVSAVYQFSCNGMFDPNITGTGHQPFYFDQLAGLYNHYTVQRSWCKLEVAPGAVATNVTMFVADRTLGSGTPINFNESSTGVSGRVLTNAARPLILRQSWDGKQYFGGDLLDNDNLQGTVAVNPTEQSYFTIAAQAMDATSTTTVLVYVELVYDAIWDELIQVASS